MDRLVVGVPVSVAGGDGRQFSCEVFHTIHRGRLRFSHQLHLHLRCLQEDAEARAPLPHRLQLQLGVGHAV